MQSTLLLITPPFTQLNTPYPATAYLKGFLNTKNISSYQCDLGIEVILSVFSKDGLTQLFQEIEKQLQVSENAARIISLQQDYINTIDAVILFLQGKNPTLSHLICQEDFLPQASRFAQTENMEWAFGNMGNADKAKHLATLYLEDLSDLIIECIDEHFGFSRYAERLARSASSFDELYDFLQKDLTYFDAVLINILSQKLILTQPKLIAISVPFPGNLYSAFRTAQWIKQNYPNIQIAMGGGFPNTELRSVSDIRVFDFFDFITLDDGEMPIENLIEFIEGKRSINELKRTFALINGTVKYINNSSSKDYKQSDVGTPDYTDLLLNKYISVIEIANPMHKMWSDGRWNKLTMAHGCYWGKCTFCDISLDYIKVYEPLAAKLLCDRMEELILQTSETGFHFVDEAAPPALMRALAIEIIKRKLIVSWWTNIRFEKSFTKDLCLLLKASGCIAVSGGLEVASDRLLALIDKGVTVAQVAKVNRNFTEAGIMVHAYLMYGFPTQTAQETIDSLEMVRQLFEAGILQSAFWHQFAMTAHSPVGLEPHKFGVRKENEIIGTFANNDIFHIDDTGIAHDTFSYGLKKSLLNFMHGIGFEFPLQNWFNFKVPRTKITADYIKGILDEDELSFFKPNTKIIWLGNSPIIEFYTKHKKGNTYEMANICLHTKTSTHTISLNKANAVWLQEILSNISVNNNKIYTLQEIKTNYEENNLLDFELFWFNKPMNTLQDIGLLSL